ncbi:MAG: glycosyltransferase [Deltaproteobacteria bacterium]|nr:glycosyltransferase [Deltaproteobacteria bacterium]MDH3382461.1 glycosyltransferase [Deltaproteobacteria bacterium]
MTGFPLLSVVLVCRNQRDLVLACVRSALREVVLLGSPFEILLIDSASTDGTREALAGMPVRWVGLEESPLLCASFGRKVGTDMATGRYILFLDGDMELEQGFLPAALDAIGRLEGVAGIVGQVFEKDPSSQTGRRDICRIGKKGKAEKFGGAILFSRQSLLRVGGYDPYIFNREENELYSRIKMAGEAVWQIPVPMALHHDPPPSTLEKVRREVLPGRKRSLGRAQAFLRSWKKGNLVFYLRQERLFFFSLLVDTASVISFLLLPSPAAWGAPAAAQLASLAVHSGSWSAGQYVLNKIAAVQFLLGLFLAPGLLRLPLPAAREAS